MTIVPKRYHIYFSPLYDVSFWETAAAARAAMIEDLNETLGYCVGSLKRDEVLMDRCEAAQTALADTSDERVVHLACSIVPSGNHMTVLRRLYCKYDLGTVVPSADGS